MNSKQKRIFALLHVARVKNREQRMNLMSWIVCRNITTSNDLSDAELSMIIDVLEQWKADNKLADMAIQYGLTNEYANEDEAF